MSKLLVFLYFPLHANFVNIAEAAHITSTVRPPRTPQSARTSQYHAFGSSACFDTGLTVAAQRREEYSIDVRLSNVTTTVRPAHIPQSARTSQKHAFGSSACFGHGTAGWHSGGIVAVVHLISLVV